MTTRQESALVQAMRDGVLPSAVADAILLVAVVDPEGYMDRLVDSQTGEWRVFGCPVCTIRSVNPHGAVARHCGRRHDWAGMAPHAKGA